MPKTSDYLNDLTNQKNILAKCLKNHGVDSSEQETFSTLVPKTVDYIDSSTGSGVMLSDLAMLSNGGGVTNPGKDDYLTDLTAQKTSLAETLQESGVEASTDETFSTLVPKANEKLSDNSAYEFYRVVTNNESRFAYLFYNCTEMTEVPKIPNPVGSAAYMFYECSSLKEQPDLDLTEATDISAMYYGCSSFPKIKSINAPKATKAEALLNGCAKATEIGDIIVPSATIGASNTSMRFFPSGPKKVGNVDISSATELRQLFYNKYFESVGVIKSGKGKNFYAMFQNTGGAAPSKIKSIAGIDFSSATTLDSTFASCTNLTDITLNGTLGISLSFSVSPLTLESAKSVINALVDYAGTDKEFAYSITFSPTTLEYLEAEGATAPNGLTWTDYALNKGWNI